MTTPQDREAVSAAFAVQSRPRGARGDADRSNALHARSGAALLAALVLALPVVAAEPAPGDEAVARARIDAQRRQIEARFATEQKACFQRFAVNDCRAESQRRRRAELAPLRREEIELNGVERRRKAADRQREIDARAAQRTERARQRHDDAPQHDDATRAERDEKAAPAHAAEPRKPGPNPPIVPRGKPRADPAPRLEREADKRSQRASEDEANAARYERERREAAAHKADVLRKNAERVKPAAPLPVPPAAVPAPDRR